MAALAVLPSSKNANAALKAPTLAGDIYVSVQLTRIATISKPTYDSKRRSSKVACLGSSLCTILKNDWKREIAHWKREKLKNERLRIERMWTMKNRRRKIGTIQSFSSKIYFILMATMGIRATGMTWVKKSNGLQKGLLRQLSFCQSRVISYRI